MTKTLRAVALAAAAFTATVTMSVARADAQSSDSAAYKPLATRAELEALRDKLGSSGHKGNAETTLAYIRARLERGDFRPGDLVWMEVHAESALTDTFTVQSDGALHLPPPVVGVLSLDGVLRSELEAKVTPFVARFVRSPRVKVRPLLRLSIQGAVARPGFYAIPSDALLADAVMVADGTTPEADPRKLKIERGGKTLLASDGVQKAIAERRTVNDIRLRDGDQLVVPRRTRAALEDNLSFMWIIVSLAGGVYGLSRAF